MKKKTLIIYDLKEKSNTERTRIIQKLYGHRERSNYQYYYERKGLLDKFKVKKENKTVIIPNKNQDLTKIVEILKQLKVKFEIAES